MLLSILNTACFLMEITVSFRKAFRLNHSKSDKPVKRNLRLNFTGRLMMIFSS